VVPAGGIFLRGAGAVEPLREPSVELRMARISLAIRRAGTTGAVYFEYEEG
jgi:hypothetical protein